MNSLAVDLAAFYNDYDSLASLEMGAPFIDPDDGRTIIPIITQNLNAGRSRGIEALLTFTPLQNWRVTVNYTYVDLDLDASGADLNRGTWLDGATPRHVFGLRSF